MLSVVRDQLTRTILIQLFCRDGKNEKYFDHDFHNYVCHIGRLWDFDVGLESSEKVLHPLEEFNECVLTSLDSFDGLRYLVLRQDGKEINSKILAERRTPMPVKITAAGGNGWKTNIRQRQIPGS